MNGTTPGFPGLLFLMMMLAAGPLSSVWADSPAGSERREGLETSITELLREHGVPGASIAVIEDYQVLWARGFGVTSLYGGAPVTETTRFQACSLSKPVAVQALLTLVESGQVDLDQPANHYLRRWQIPDNEGFSGDAITVRQLVTHSAGLTASFFPGYRPGEELPASLVDMLLGIPPTTSEAVVPNLAPGSRWRYSGGGLLVVQLLIEDVTGEDFAAFMQSTVLGPLDMRDSTYVAPYPHELRDVSAKGYSLDGTPVPGGYREYPAAAVAGLWTTASDLARSMVSVQKSANGLAGGLLTPAVARQMLSVQDTGTPPVIDKIPTFDPRMGLGYLLEGRDPVSGNPPRFWHWGDNPGFKALQVGTLEGGKGVVVLTNSDVGVEVTRPIAELIAAAYGWSL